MKFNNSKKILLGLLLVTTVGILTYQQSHLQKIYADEVVRFHVLANSDSAEDQKLKLQVRNQVGAYVSGLLKGVHTKK